MVRWNSVWMALLVLLLLLWLLTSSFAKVHYCMRVAGKRPYSAHDSLLLWLCLALCVLSARVPFPVRRLHLWTRQEAGAQ